MKTLRQHDDPARKAIREARWLLALEQELKSRIGWVDETVSPFAAKTQTARTAAKIKIQEKIHDTFHPVKAA